MELNLNENIEGWIDDRLTILEALPLGSLVVSDTGGGHRLIRLGHWTRLAEGLDNGMTSWDLLISSSVLKVARIGGTTIKAGTLYKLPVGSVVENGSGERMVKKERDAWQRVEGGGLLTSGQVVAVLGRLRIVTLKIWDEEPAVEEVAVKNPPIVSLTEYGVEYWNNTMKRTEVKWGLWTTDPTERIARDHGKIFVDKLGAVKVTRVLSRVVAGATVVKDFEAEREAERKRLAEPQSVELAVTVRVGDVVKDRSVIEALPVGTVLRTGKGNDMLRVEDGWKFASSSGRDVYSSDLLLGLNDVLTVHRFGE